MHPRFYLTTIQQTGSAVTINDAQTVHQIVTVLRLGKHDRITVFSAEKEIELAIESIGKRSITASVLQEHRANREPTVALTLYVSLLKKDTFEFVLQKGVELGVWAFVPIITDRSVVRAVSHNKLLRYRTIIKEATEQCGGRQIAGLGEPVPFTRALHDLEQKQGAKLIAWEGENRQQLVDAAGPPAKEFHLFIGPEGGFSANEVSQAQAAGCSCVSLGKRILRAETAAIAGAALILLR
ncbi:MAG: RsmE family RNA methyltransferase [Patescibacteria group bacterium]